MTTNHIDRTNSTETEGRRTLCRGFYPDLPYERVRLAAVNSEPAPSTVEAAATDKKQDNYYDEQCGGIHDRLQAETNRAAWRGSKASTP